MKSCTSLESVRRKSMLKKAMALAVGSVLLLASCQREEEKTAPAAVRTRESAQTASIKMFEAVGVIQRLDPDHGVVVIKHEKIEGFMDAMTMPFHVERQELLSGLQPGDKVRFTLRDTPDQTHVVEIQKIL